MHLVQGDGNWMGESVVLGIFGPSNNFSVNQRNSEFLEMLESLQYNNSNPPVSMLASLLSK